jgi:D-apiose dehydrogenase
MKTVVIGLGEAGLGIHLPAARGCVAVTLVGACDPNEARRSRAASAFGVPVFADVDAMFAATSPELVIVATPPDSHAELCLRAFAAGADVLCEKPFTPTLDEADRVLATAAAAGRRIALNHEFREMPIFRALLDEARRPGSGPLAFVQIWQLMHVVPGSELGWRGQLRQRTLFEAGAHLVDFAIALFGGLPISVQASTSSAGAASPIDAVVLVTLEFSGGRLAQITQDRVCAGARQYFEVRAETRDASLRASFGGRSRVSAGLFRSTRPHLRFEHGLSGIAWKEMGSTRVPLARNPANPTVVATRAVLDQTVRAFQTKAAAPAEGRLGRDVLRVIAAAYESASTGRRIPLEGDRPAGTTAG